MTLRISLALALLTAAPVFAQPAPKQPPAPRQPQPAPAADDMIAFEKDLDALFSGSGLTSDQAAARAGAASPTVRRRVAEIEVAVAQTEATELQRVPQVGVRSSYTRLSPIAALSLGIPGAPPIVFLSDAYVNQANLSVPLSDYVFRYPKLIDAARLATDVAKASKASSEVNAGEDARLAYYEWVRAKLQVLIAQRQLAQVRATLTQVRALTEVQRLSRADLLRVESQEAEAEHVLDQLQNLAELREEQLRLLIGAPSNEPLAIGEDIRTAVAAPAPAPLDDLVTVARRKRLEFKVINLGLLAKQKQADAELANKLPRLSAFGSADYDNPNLRQFPQANKFTFTWQVGAQLTWQLNDYLGSRATDHRIRGEENELRADRENLEHGTRIEVLAAQQAVLIADHALATSQKGLTAAEEGYRVRKELLNAERATAVELVDAETDLTRARITALNARVDLRVARAQLEHALGNDVK